MTQSMHNGFGATRFPIPGTIDSAYDVDPGQATILGLVEAAINAELGDAWRKMLGELPNTHPLIRGGSTNPVGVASPLEVTPQQMTQWKAAWPVLAAYRQGEPEFSWLSTERRQLKQEWSVDWVIGPLDAGQIIRLGRFTVAVARIVDAVISRGYHPAYKSGARQFFGQFASIETKSVQGPGIAQSLTEESGGGYYGLTVTLESIERDVMDGAAYAGLIDVDNGYVAVGTGTADTLTEIVDSILYENKTPDPG
jgi:hypothetical protein